VERNFLIMKNLRLLLKKKHEKERRKNNLKNWKRKKAKEKIIFVKSALKRSAPK